MHTLPTLTHYPLCYSTLACVCNRAGSVCNHIGSVCKIQEGLPNFVPAPGTFIPRAWDFSPSIWDFCSQHLGQTESTPQTTHSLFPVLCLYNLVRVSCKFLQQIISCRSGIDTNPMFGRFVERISNTLIPGFQVVNAIGLTFERDDSPLYS